MPSQRIPSDRSPSRDGAVSVEELYGRFRRPAAALARRVLVDEDLVEDVLQEVFLSVWRHPGAFDPARGSFVTWLMTVVHHKAVDAVRREDLHRRRQACTGDGAFEHVPDLGRDTAGDACDRATHAQVRTALSALPAGQREALTLAYFGGYSQQQIAALTATPLGTVKSRTGIAVRQLRRDLHRLRPTS